MPKLVKRNHKDEEKCKKLHMDMNMKVAPTRLEDIKNFPAYLIPNLDPLQKRVNRIENTVNHEARCARQRVWRK